MFLVLLCTKRLLVIRHNVFLNGLGKREEQETYGACESV